jgi:predicted transposase YdaD
MNTYQALRQEGRQEGRQEARQEGARLRILRGRFKGASADFLAYQSELSLTEVENMLRGYDKVYQFWANKKRDKGAILEVAHLAEQEVRYLMNLFTEKLN